MTYIPGLPAECGSPKKSAKRRKKKKNEGPTSNLGRENGHRGSTSSESEVSLKGLKKRPLKVFKSPVSKCNFFLQF